MLFSHVIMYIVIYMFLYWSIKSNQIKSRRGHLLERERGSYEKGKELSLFNGGTCHKEKGHLLENKRGTY